MTEAANVQVNSDGGMMSVLMALQKSVTSVEAQLRRLDERIGETLAIKPEVESLKERVSKMETVAQTLKEENDKRLSRLWSAVQGMAAVGAALFVLFCWAVDHFRMK